MVTQPWSGVLAFGHAAAAFSSERSETGVRFSSAKEWRQVVRIHDAVSARRNGLRQPEMCAQPPEPELYRQKTA
jgi:hypothetical protein